jgi:[glutamine synthetase] adenylyltransferase / [glutamine synthetase]-adenylyl-L-tyrosine phosphorylase
MPTSDFGTDLLAKALPGSRYLQRALDYPPACFDPARLAVPLTAPDIRALLDGRPAQDEAALASWLRQVREAVMIHVIARDLGGAADLAEVMSTMTVLAEECVRCALRRLDAWLGRIHGRPLGALSAQPQSLLVVAMGKLGGEELNVSSDIDLIFLYGEEGETSGPGVVSNHEYFTRLGRRLINILAEFTADGYVFRVDMRLRPYGDSGPLVMGLEMLENYLHTQGREWERYAWVKAREIGGQPAPELAALITPFVYRRHLDFSAIASLRELHAQIRAEVRRRDLHDNIKLGPGGIREIEFVAQVFQIVRGGHDAGLRLRPTLATLACLAQRRLLPVEAVEELRSAYVFLRNLEHRLQYLEDQQTQMLPADPEDLAAVAHAMGCADAAALRTALEGHRSCVTRHFEAVFASAAAGNSEHPLAGVWTGALSSEEAQARLRALGYQDAPRIFERLRELRASGTYRRMSASTQACVDKLVPRLLELASQFEHPGATLERLARVIESIGRRESYLALLLEYPGALSRLAALAATSPWAADYLARHPVLLDELISQQAFEPPDWARLAAQLAQDLDEIAGNTERQMDILRHFKQVQTLRLLTQDLAGTLPLETLSDHLSDLACIILRQVLRLAWEGLRTRHRDVPLFAVVGYGKLGGKELGYASDLDLIFLYDDDRPDAAENYARLAQRINTWLASLTRAGVLYETDLRLRPDGASGLLVSELDAFAEYQRSKAWVWEHQALTRARFVAGDPPIGASFEQLRVAILRLPREPAKLRGEVQAMRSRMLAGHPNASGLFDVKHDRGGIVDVEFIVQYLVLGFAHRHPELTGNIGNLALLKLAGGLGLIPIALANATHHSYREFRRMQHALRLQGQQYARVPEERVSELVRPVVELWSEVFGDAERPARAPAP